MNEVIKAYANVLMLRFDCSQGQLYYESKMSFVCPQILECLFKCVFLHVVCYIFRNKKMFSNPCFFCFEMVVLCYDQ